MGGSAPTTGYKYFMDLHFVAGLARGGSALASAVKDGLMKIIAGDREGWTGLQTQNGTIGINAPDLFGGDEKEGGLVGELDIMFGGPDQGANAYLTSVQGGTQPGYRNLFSVVYKQGQVAANNPYIKPWGFLRRRITGDWYGGTCWHESKAPIPLEGGTSGSPGSGTYRWAMRHTVSAYVAASPAGDDWSEETAFTPGYGSELNIGDYVLSTNYHGATSYAPWTDPGAWVEGPNVGSSGFFDARVSYIDGRIFHAKGNSYAYADSPSGPYTLETGRAAIIVGNADFVVRYHGPNAGGATDGYHVSRSVNKGATFTLAWDIPVATAGYSYAYYLDAGAANASVIALAGRTYEDATVCFWSTDGFLTQNTSVMPAGQTGALRQLIHVEGEEWIALVDGGECTAGPSFLLRSTDDLESFERVDLGLGVTATIGKFFMNNMAVDRSTGRLIFVAQAVGYSAFAVSTDDRIDWDIIPLGFGPNSVYLIAPDDPGTASTSARYCMNPAHVIYQVLTDPDVGMGYPEAVIDDDSFTAAANQLYAEGLGVNLPWIRPTTIEEFIGIVLDHAGAVMAKDRRTGLFKLRLLRKDYDIEDLPVFNQSNCRMNGKGQRPSPADSVNELQVTYTDYRDLKEKTVPVRNAAAIAAAGGVVTSKSHSLTGLPTEALAQRCGERDLDAMSLPLWRFDLTFLRDADTLEPGSPFLFDWAPLGIQIVMRVAGDIDYGNAADGDIRAMCVEDVFSLPDSVYSGTLPPPNTGAPPTPQATAALAMEMPYRDLVRMLTADQLDAFPEESGYVAAAAKRPSAGHLNFKLATRTPPDDYAEVDTGDFAPSAVLSADVAAGSDTILLEGWTDLRGAAVGAAAFLANADGTVHEMIRIDALTADGATMTVGRGCGDTLPKAWPAGTRLWCYEDNAAVDPTPYITGETIDAKVLPRTSLGQLARVLADEMSVELAQRWSRPYPPGDIKINGVSAYEIGAPTPGGGGGGGGPTSPPAVAPGGAPASTELGPNGGYPDDGVNPIPLPTVFDTDIMPGGDFSDPEDLDQWGTKTGEPLSSGWSIVDGAARFVGRATGSAPGVSTPIESAYLHALQLLLPHSTIPRYEVTITADVYCAPNTKVAIGVAYGLAGGVMQYQDVSTPETFIEFTELSHTTSGPLTVSIPLQGNGTPQWAVLPVLTVTSESIYEEVEAWFDNVTFGIHEVPTPSTIFVPDHIDFDSGLTGWVQRSAMTGTAIDPTVVASGGELSVTINSSTFRHVTFINEDPITTADATGKFIGVSGELWSNDPTVVRNVPYGGICLGLASKYAGVYSFHPLTAFLRGDWTPHEGWRPLDFHPDRTWHAAVQVSHHAGLHLPVTSKIRNLQVRVTDEVID